jgi:hypothetical protein
MSYKSGTRAARARARLLLGVAYFAGAIPAWAASGESSAPAPTILTANDAPTGESVYVWGLRENTIGQATSSGEGTVNFALFEDRPLLRPGELVEVVPGLAVTQHSGSGKANQYFMRGFNLDHGTDFSVSFDGVPLNLPTHAHGQGYLDLNFITPEFVQVITYRKGTYFADVGDFSAAGTAAFETFSLPPAPFAETDVGKDNYYRLLGMANLGNDSYIGADLTYSDGPWANPENLRKVNLLGHFALGNNWTLTALGYTAKWNSTDQVPERAIDSGLITPLDAIDPSDGGKTSRFIASLRNRNLDGWDAVAYVQKYDLKLWSNFTYFLDDPVNGDQFEQADNRWIFGGSAAKTWAETLAGWQITTGAQFRDDDIGKVALYHTDQRVQIGTVRSDAVNEWASGLWANGEQSFGTVRVSLGLRLDVIGANVSSDNPLNSGSASDSLVSPKLTVAWQALPNLELYADAGRGFHSNDARGATETIAPKSGLPVDPVKLIAPALGAETGLRWNYGTFTATATLFWLHLDSELTFAGDAGDTESSSATQRFGGEFLLNWHPIDRIDIDFSAAGAHARYLGRPTGGDRIPNAIGYMMTGGISAMITDNVSATFTARYLGPSPLTQGGLINSRSAVDTNFLMRYRWGRFTFTGQILNLFNSSDDDIQYFYASRLPGEPADGVNDLHIHPMEPRTWRAGVRVAF